MRQSRLPDGFGVRIDPAVRSYADGRVLIGGSPTRMLKLAPTAAAMIGDGFLEVSDQQTALVARRLLDSGVANPRPRLTPAVDDVTIVVPLRDNPEGLARLVASLRGHRIVVVDDGSSTPVAAPPSVGCEITVLRHDVSRGPAAARNAGLRAATTEFVAFLDSDVVPRPGWLEVMLGHFSDPEVALVAPRIVALDAESNDLARYEHTRSSLDLGPREAAVHARSMVSYVPSAAMLARRRVLLDEGGFDETMHVAEDVDLCWRLEQQGWRLRYEPAAQVAHDHRVSFRTWFARKAFYGTGAAPLGERHAAAVSPLVVSPWTVVAIALLATLSKIGMVGAVVTMGFTVLPAASAVHRARPVDPARRDLCRARVRRGAVAVGIRGVPALLAGHSAGDDLVLPDQTRRRRGRGRRGSRRLVPPPRGGRSRSRALRRLQAPRRPGLRGRAVAGRGPRTQHRVPETDADVLTR